MTSWAIACTARYRYREEMTDELPPIAILLKEARGAYGAAIHREVASRGLDPLPPQGAFVVAALHYEQPLENILRERGRAMERAQTLAHLRESGYIVDDAGGLHLTEKGHECAHAVADATSNLTRTVVETVGPDGFESFVAALLALVENKESGES